MEKFKINISIIIPIYNSEKFIDDTINSIKNQSYQNFECLLIDDHSTDSTEKRIRKIIVDDDRFFLYKRPEKLKKGASTCRNYGFSLAKGKFIQWFDSDDIMHPLMLEKKMNIFTEGIDFVVCQTVAFKGRMSNLISYPMKIISSEPFVDLFTGKIVYYTPGPIWRKSFLNKQTKMFNEDLLNVQEWEFYCRLLLQKPSNKIINEPLIYYRKHENSIWGQERNKDKIMSEFYAVASVFKLGKLYEKSIIRTYFLRLGKLYKELSKIEDAKIEKEIINLELKRVFLKKKLKFKDILRFINILYIRK